LIFFSSLTGKSQSPKATLNNYLQLMIGKKYEVKFKFHTKSKNQFAIVRYEVKQQNDRYQKLVEDNKFDRIKRNFAISILIIVLIVGIFWYRRRKIRLEQEKELENKNTQLKLSKKVYMVLVMNY
jgi:hypothetical protein